MGKVLGIVNRKGGVGKTTTATTLSYLLSKEGCKVALIDFDGQRHTTKLCGVTAPEQLSVTIYDILKCIVMNEELPDKGSYMIRTETGVDLIPANNKLDNFDKLMCDTDFAEYKLKEFVDTIKEQYDYILIDGMEMFRHEMLQKRLVMIKKMELAATEQMEAVRKGGQAAALARFQDIEPPGDREENKKRIWNGIYILNGEEQKIAVHERIAEAFLTPYACEFGRRENGYFYYTLQSAALPLYELKGVVPECQEMIVSEESLYATICTHYPAYRERYNALVAQEQQIPQIDAPANLFLQEQLDRGQTEADEETVHEEAFAEEADEDEYGEQVDYGFGV